MVLFPHVCDETHMNFGVLPKLQIDIEGLTCIDKVIAANKSLKRYFIVPRPTYSLSDRFLKEAPQDKNHYEERVNHIVVELSNIQSTNSQRRVVLVDALCDTRQSGHSGNKNSSAICSDLLSSSTPSSEKDWHPQVLNFHDAEFPKHVNQSTEECSLHETALPSSFINSNASPPECSALQSDNVRNLSDVVPLVSSSACSRLKKALKIKILRKEGNSSHGDDDWVVKKCCIPGEIIADSSKDVLGPFESIVAESQKPSSIIGSSVSSSMQLSIDLSEADIVNIADNMLKTVPPMTLRGDPRVHRTESNTSGLNKTSVEGTCAEKRNEQHWQGIHLSNDLTNQRKSYDDSIDMCEESLYLRQITRLHRPKALLTKPSNTIPSRLETWKLLDDAFVHPKVSAKQVAKKTAKNKLVNLVEPVKLKLKENNIACEKTHQECQKVDNKCTVPNPESKKSKTDIKTSQQLSFYGKPFLSSKEKPSFIPLVRLSDYVVEPSDPRKCLLGNRKPKLCQLKLPRFAASSITSIHHSKEIKNGSGSSVISVKKTEHELLGAKPKQLPHSGETDVDVEGLSEKLKSSLVNSVVLGQQALLETNVSVFKSPYAAFDIDTKTFRGPCTPPVVELPCSEGSEYHSPYKVEMSCSEGIEHAPSSTVVSESCEMEFIDIPSIQMESRVDCVSEIDAVAFRGAVELPCSDNSEYNTLYKVEMHCSEGSERATSSTIMSESCELGFIDTQLIYKTSHVDCVSEIDAVAFRGPRTPPAVEFPCVEGSEYCALSEVKVRCSDVSEHSPYAAMGCSSSESNLIVNEEIHLATNFSCMSDIVPINVPGFISDQKLGCTGTDQFVVPIVDPALVPITDCYDDYCRDTQKLDKLSMDDVPSDINFGSWNTVCKTDAQIMPHCTQIYSQTRERGQEGNEEMKAKTTESVMNLLIQSVPEGNADKMNEVSCSAIQQGMQPGVIIGSSSEQQLTFTWTNVIEDSSDDSKQCGKDLSAESSTTKSKDQSIQTQDLDEADKIFQAVDEQLKSVWWDVHSTRNAIRSKSGYNRCNVDLDLLGIQEKVRKIRVELLSSTGKNSAVDLVEDDSESQSQISLNPQCRHQDSDDLTISKCKYCFKSAEDDDEDKSLSTDSQHECRHSYMKKSTDVEGHERLTSESRLQSNYNHRNKSARDDKDEALSNESRYRSEMKCMSANVDEYKDRSSNHRSRSRHSHQSKAVHKHKHKGGSGDSRSRSKYQRDKDDGQSSHRRSPSKHNNRNKSAHNNKEERLRSYIQSSSKHSYQKKHAHDDKDESLSSNKSASGESLSSRKRSK